MSAHRYRAYISYSHADERWAAWLQRALESYRVPRRLRTQHPERNLPRRVAPVFRDREDLSTAHDLSDSLREALRCSEALVVICSPAAAASKWVNEEIRQFRQLGRSDRIFCMVVEGEPGNQAASRPCFPAALVGEAGESAAEPLAADARAHADGKHLARLKLVAALLGVRLDELRQRDLKRRRIWQAVGALTVVAALALAAVTVFSVLSRQQERENAERMAAFVVELGEDLQSDIDLETLGRISTRAMDYLQRLDPASLSPETSIKVGLALRQLGHVNLGQGNLPQALNAYERSLELFEGLAEANPQRQDILFEKAQAEFYIGDYYYWQSDLEHAWAPWQRYLESAQALLAADPDNPRWLLEVSYGTMNLLLLRVNSGESANRPLLDASDEAVDLARQVLQALPEDAEALSHYSNTLAWAADAEVLACELPAALSYRKENLSMASVASRANPASKHLRERLAYAHAGVAAVQIDLGEIEASERNRRASIDILVDLAARDPSNELIAHEIAAGRVQLAALLMNTDREDDAVALVRLIQQHLTPPLPIEHQTEMVLNDYVDFVLVHADLVLRLGDAAQASGLLNQARDILLARLVSGQLSRKIRNQASRLRYLWFELDQRDIAADYPSLKETEPTVSGEYRDCRDADLAARLAVIEADPQQARRQAAYLAARNYRNPGYVRFCERHPVCAD